MFQNVVAALETFASVTLAKDDECYMLSNPSRFDYSILALRVSDANYHVLYMTDGTIGCRIYSMYVQLIEYCDYSFYFHFWFASSL